MRTKKFDKIILGLTAILASSFTTIAFTIPDLAPGTEYRIAVITLGRTDATSADIGYYNSFIQDNVATYGSAELNALDATWTVIGSTATVDARDNTGTNPYTDIGVPIFLLDGTRVASSNADFWDGRLDHGINVGTNLDIRNGVVWTGTMRDGTAFHRNYVLGTRAGRTIWGRSSITDSFWTYGGRVNKRRSYPLYGLSSVLTVPPTAVPETGQTALFLVAACVALGVFKQRVDRQGE